MNRLNEIEWRIIEQLDKYCEPTTGNWETAEKLSRILLNVAAIKAVGVGGKVRLGEGGPTIDPPKRKGSTT